MASLLRPSGMYTSEDVRALRAGRGPSFRGDAVSQAGGVGAGAGFFLFSASQRRVRPASAGAPAHWRGRAGLIFVPGLADYKGEAIPWPQWESLAPHPRRRRTPWPKSEIANLRQRLAETEPRRERGSGQWRPKHRSCPLHGSRPAGNLRGMREVVASSLAPPKPDGLEDRRRLRSEFLPRWFSFPPTRSATSPRSRRWPATICVLKPARPGTWPETCGSWVCTDCC